MVASNLACHKPTWWSRPLWFRWYLWGLWNLPLELCCCLWQTGWTLPCPCCWTLLGLPKATGWPLTIWCSFCTQHFLSSPECPPLAAHWWEAPAPWSRIPWSSLEGQGHGTRARMRRSKFWCSCTICSVTQAGRIRTCSRLSHRFLFHFLSAPHPCPRRRTC